MGNDALEQKLHDLYSSGDIQELSTQLAELGSEKMVQEWPQSGERIRGRENILAVNQHYEGATGTAPSLTLRRIVRPGDAWIVEGTIDYGDGTPSLTVRICVGATALTRMPSGPSSLASEAVKPTTPALAAA